MAEVLLSIVMCLLCAAYHNAGHPLPQTDLRQERTARQNPIASLLQSIEWLPIEINVPEAFGALSTTVNDGFAGIQSGISGFGNFAGSIIQRIPIINRFVINQVTPRPNAISPATFYLLVPKNVFRNRLLPASVTNPRPNPAAVTTHQFDPFVEFEYNGDFL